MKIAILHSNHWNNKIGGGELTTKYWYEQGINEGLDIDIITNATEQLNHDYDLYLIGDFPEFKHKSYLDYIIKNKQHGFLVHNSIPWFWLQKYYRNAKFIVTLAPDHAKELRLDHIPNIVTAPFVDYKMFRPGAKNRRKEYIYIGLLHDLKIQHSMKRFIRSKLDITFHLYGDKHPDFKLESENLKMYNQVNIEQTAKLMQEYENFVWYLDRYGCYGRTLVEALLSEMKLHVNKDKFGLFKYDWIDKGRSAIIDNLEKDRSEFWQKLTKYVD